MKKAVPPLWIKRFRHNGKYYCYDVGVNNIMEIDQAMDRYLAVYPGGTGAPDVEPLKTREAEAAFLDYRVKTGGFLNRRKIRLKFPFTPSEYERLLGRLINHMVLNVTNGCNMRCQYCRTTAADPAALRGPRMMSWKTIRKALNYFIDHASYIIEETNRDLVLGFYGGEPLLEYDNIVRAVVFLRNNHPVLFPRFRFSMTTNGTLLTEKMIHFFIKHKFHLLLSLDGPAELHDRYRKMAGGKNSFDVIEKKLALIRNIDDRYYSEKIGFSIVLSPEFRLTDVIEFFRRNHFSEKRVYMFSMVEAKWTDFFEAFDLQAEFHKLRDDEDLLKINYKKNKCAGISDVLLNNLFEGNLQDIHGRVPLMISDDIYPNGICLPGLHKVFVGTDGKFHLCEKTDNSQAIGDLNRGFDVEKVFALIEGYIQMTDHCRDCWAVRLCKDCYLSALTEQGYSKEEKKKSCRRRKIALSNGFKDYVEIMEKNGKAFGERFYEPGIISDAFKYLGRG